MGEPIRVTVNGRAWEGVVQGGTLLVDWLRDDLDLTGAKTGCKQGICGTCTIHLNGVAVKSCLMLAVQADGCEVSTVEGLAEAGQLASLQAAFVEHGAIQCGFCTPGLLMAATDLLNENADPSDTEIREALAGNLCRCTGYVKVVAAVASAARALARKEVQP